MNLDHLGRDVPDGIARLTKAQQTVKPSSRRGLRGPPGGGAGRPVRQPEVGKHAAEGGDRTRPREPRPGS